MSISLPKKPKIVESKDNRAAIEIEGCHPGFGLTLGNSLRRVLLSSLPGAAIVSVKIKGVKHEFSTIEHVLEDVIQIILNLKQIRFKLLVGQSAKATLKVKGEKEVTAADIKTSAELKVISSDVHIATLTNRKAGLEIEMDIESGLGYMPAEQRKKEKVEIGKIAIDASFTPIRRVNYVVEPMRVGDRTDYNRLRFNIETDGSISPEEAFHQAAQILVDHYRIFTELEEKTKEKKKKLMAKAGSSDKAKKKKNSFPIQQKVGQEDITKTKIEDMKLSTRTINALNEAGFKTAASLIKKKEETLQKAEGLGFKGVKEIKRALSKLGLTLK